MAQFIVQNLEDDVRDKLRDMARSHDQSMEEMVLDILRRAVMGQSGPSPGLGTQISQRFVSLGLDEEIPELRGHPVEPPNFDE